jgi:hypothetical protein
MVFFLAKIEKNGENVDICKADEYQGKVVFR